MSTHKKIAAFVFASAIALGGAAQAETTGQYIDDTAVTTKVKANLVADSSLHAADVTVNTNHGVVSLTGTVDTPKQYVMAAQDASTVDGVKTVSNMLQVRQAAQ